MYQPIAYFQKHIGCIHICTFQNEYWFPFYTNTTIPAKLFIIFICIYLQEIMIVDMIFYHVLAVDTFAFVSIVQYLVFIF